MTYINMLEKALGVDLEMMLSDIISTVLAPCDAQVNQGGVIAYFNSNGYLVATEYEENGVERTDWSEVGKVQLVEHIRERLKNIAMRIAVETLNEVPTQKKGQDE